VLFRSLDKEIIFKSDLDRIIGKRPFEEDEQITATIAAANQTDLEKHETPKISEPSLESAIVENNNQPSETINESSSDNFESPEKTEE
jgi:hypothetical protein